MLQTGVVGVPVPSIEAKLVDCEISCPSPEADIC